MYKVIFSPKAHCKQFALVNACKTEIAWRGSIKKIDDSTYYVDDIYVPPQYVSGVFFDTEDMEFRKWLFTEVPLEEKLLLHGHSHVNMPCLPSGTDIRTQERFVNSLDDGVYIFIICNKKAEANIMLHDVETHKVYTSGNGEVKYLIDGLDEFVDESLKKLKPLTDLPESEGNKKKRNKNKRGAKNVLNKGK